jgi:hypothetical protein
MTDNDTPEVKIARISEHNRVIHPHGHYEDSLYIGIMRKLLEGINQKEIANQLDVSLTKVKDAQTWADLLFNNEEAKILGQALAEKLARRRRVEGAKKAKWSPSLSQVGDIPHLCPECNKETQHRGGICLECVRSSE